MVDRIELKEYKDNEKVCAKCGKCCWYVSKITGKVTKCKHLLWIKGNEVFKSHYMCRIYQKRNAQLRSGKGYVIEGKGNTMIACVYRISCKYDYPGCPLNTSRPIHPIYSEGLGDKI